MFLMVLGPSFDFVKSMGFVIGVTWCNLQRVRDGIMHLSSRRLLHYFHLLAQHLILPFLRLAHGWSTDRPVHSMYGPQTLHLLNCLTQKGQILRMMDLKRPLQLKFFLRTCNDLCALYKC